MCVVLGLDKSTGARCQIIDEQHSRSVAKINPYLTEGPTLYVEKRAEPLSNVQPMVWGNKPTDGGNLLLSGTERAHLLQAHPLADRFVHRFVGSDECINGIE